MKSTKIKRIFSAALAAVMLFTVLPATVSFAAASGLSVFDPSVPGGTGAGAVVDVNAAGLVQGEQYTLEFNVKSNGTTGFRVRYFDEQGDSLVYNDETNSAHSSSAATAAGTTANQIPALFNHDTIPGGGIEVLTVNFTFGASIPDLSPLYLPYIGLFGLVGGLDFEVLGFRLLDKDGDVIAETVSMTGYHDAINLRPNEFGGAVINIAEAGLQAGQNYSIVYNVKSNGTTGFRVRYGDYDNGWQHNDDAIVNDFPANGRNANNIPTQFADGTILQGWSRLLTVDFNLNPNGMGSIGLFGNFGGDEYEVLGTAILDGAGNIITMKGSMDEVCGYCGNAPCTCHEGITLHPNSFAGAVIDVSEAGLVEGQEYTLVFSAWSYGAEGFRVRYGSFIDSEWVHNDGPGGPDDPAGMTNGGNVANQIPAYFNNSISDGETKKFFVNFTLYGGLTSIDNRDLIGIFGQWGDSGYEVMALAILDSNGKIVSLAGDRGGIFCYECNEIFECKCCENCGKHPCGGGGYANGNNWWGCNRVFDIQPNHFIGFDFDYTDIFGFEITFDVEGGSYGNFIGALYSWEDCYLGCKCDPSGDHCGAGKNALARLLPGAPWGTDGYGDNGDFIEFDITGAGGKPFQADSNGTVRFFFGETMYHQNSGFTINVHWQQPGSTITIKSITFLGEDGDPLFPAVYASDCTKCGFICDCTFPLTIDLETAVADGWLNESGGASLTYSAGKLEVKNRVDNWDAVDFNIGNLPDGGYKITVGFETLDGSSKIFSIERASSPWGPYVQSDTAKTADTLSFSFTVWNGTHSSDGQERLRLRAREDLVEYAITSIVIERECVVRFCVDCDNLTQYWCYCGVPCDTKGGDWCHGCNHDCAGGHLYTNVNNWGHNCGRHCGDMDWENHDGTLISSPCEVINNQPADCSKCGFIHSLEVCGVCDGCAAADCTDHTFGAWGNNTATATTPGTETRSCTRQGCTHSETRPTPALNAPRYTVTTRATRAFVGKEVIVDIGLINNPGFRNITIKVTYDPEYLELVFDDIENDWYFASLTTAPTPVGERVIKDLIVHDAANGTITLQLRSNNAATTDCIATAIGTLKFIALKPTLVTGTLIDVLASIGPEGASHSTGLFDIAAAETRIVNISSVMLGDLDGDGFITNFDLTLLTQIRAGLNPPGANLDAADLDGDGFITNFDLTLLTQYRAGLITSFPAG